jgi:hypothetical protein
MPAAAATDLGELYDVIARGAYADVTPDLPSILGHPGRRFEEFAAAQINIMALRDPSIFIGNSASHDDAAVFLLRRKKP